MARSRAREKSAVLTASSPVWLFDVDNTLLDNDRFGTDLGAHLETSFGAAQRDRYWTLYAAIREETGYADYLAALQRFRAGLDDEPALLQSGAFVLDYPFADRLYPRALEVVARCRARGLAAVFSDGDIVFQPRKIVRAGIWDAFDGNVLVCVHKERSLESMEHRYPAPHYVIVDDKPRLLAAIKRVMGERVTTIFARQGHYAVEAAASVIDPAPDVAVDRIGDLLDLVSSATAALDFGSRHACTPKMPSTSKGGA
jgi:FMN phosphatase YigB (HAD superfamily)